MASSDSILAYSVGRFGAAGFAVPNPGNDRVTLNETIADIVAMVGKQMLAINSRADRDMTTPPSINTVRDLHKLYLRVRQIISTRTVEVSERIFETNHVSPESQPFLVFPTPYLYIRNRWLKRYTQLMLTMISDLMQHTENRREFDISPSVARIVRQYMDRIYYDMATDLFGKDKPTAKAEAFLLTEADFTGWNWIDWYVGTESIETVVHSEWVFTEDDLAVLSQGIAATNLPKLSPFAGTDNPDAANGSLPGDLSSTAVTSTASGMAAPAWPAGTNP